MENFSSGNRSEDSPRQHLYKLLTESYLETIAQPQFSAYYCSVNYSVNIRICPSKTSYDELIDTFDFEELMRADLKNITDGFRSLVERGHIYTSYLDMFVWRGNSQEYIVAYIYARSVWRSLKDTYTSINYERMTAAFIMCILEYFKQHSNEHDLWLAWLNNV